MSDDIQDYPPLKPHALEHMARIAARFLSEDYVIERHIIDVGQPIPMEEKYQDLKIHPAAEEFFCAVSSDGWKLTGWDYDAWRNEHYEAYKQPGNMKTLGIEDIRRFLTVYMRQLYWSSLCHPYSITIQWEKGFLPQLLARLIELQLEAT